MAGMASQAGNLVLGVGRRWGKKEHLLVIKRTIGKIFLRSIGRIRQERNVVFPLLPLNDLSRLIHETSSPN